MLEALIYLISAATSLAVMCYAVHMLVGDLVSIDTEYLLILITFLVGVVLLALMAWDVIQRRTNRK
jgi:hypothetical protein